MAAFCLFILCSVWSEDPGGFRRNNIRVSNRQMALQAAADGDVCFMRFGEIADIKLSSGTNDILATFLGTDAYCT